MVRSFECPRCERRYPPTSTHKRCVVCRDSEGFGMDTVQSDSMPTHDHGKAKKLKEQVAEFDRRYERHEERRRRTGHADPDALGAMEGRRLARFWRSMEAAVTTSEGESQCPNPT